MNKAAYLLLLTLLVAFVQAGEVNDLLKSWKDLETLKNIASGDKALYNDAAFQKEAEETLDRIRRVVTNMTPDERQNMRLSVAKHIGPQGAQKILAFSKMLKRLKSDFLTQMSSL
ncbi:uncharacterized protein [Branchiostoma lanceolatum]|uniref:uncharacterized protein n=1 Tax=Branchiostoma lanceolatum TaxID=7740 RepID=UPI0034525D96